MRVLKFGNNVPYYRNFSRCLFLFLHTSINNRACSFSIWGTKWFSIAIYFVGLFVYKVIIIIIIFLRILRIFKQICENFIMSNRNFNKKVIFHQMVEFPNEKDEFLTKYVVVDISIRKTQIYNKTVKSSIKKFHFWPVAFLTKNIIFRKRRIFYRKDKFFNKKMLIFHKKS